MVANHIHDALSQVRHLRAVVLEKRMFYGYSGRARIIGGAAALIGTLVMSRPTFPDAELVHLAGWAVVLLIALVSNYGALAAWILSKRKEGIDTPELLPAIEAIPALSIGAITSVSLVMHEQYALLFGIWMCFYGLVHVVYRLSLPAMIYGVGVFYMVAGAVCLLYSPLQFTNPWPMGLVFFLGETIGGVILYQHRLSDQQQHKEQDHGI